MGRVSRWFQPWAGPTGETASLSRFGSRLPSLQPDELAPDVYSFGPDQHLQPKRNRLSTPAYKRSTIAHIVRR